MYRTVLCRPRSFFNEDPAKVKEVVREPVEEDGGLFVLRKVLELLAAGCSSKIVDFKALGVH
jgi:hypothetical protein